MEPKFSIVVVCLNPGDKLKNTLESIERQTFTDYEIVVKDGLSKDGSIAFARKMQEKFRQRALENGKELPALTLSEQKDTGIYDAMNQAAALSKGRYLYFLNCGDTFYDENVLSQMAELIEENPAAQGIYYGNIYERVTSQVVTSNPRIDAFACYRNVPCHQACFYDRKLLSAHPFDTRYQVRADYEQFLWCFFQDHFKEDVSFSYRNMLIADYEGGGFSESRENRKLSEKEHGEIVHKYMSRAQVMKYKLIMWITLAPLRTKIARNEKTAGIYNGLKKMLYSRK